MYRFPFLCVSLLVLTFCKPSGSTKSSKPDNSNGGGSQKEVKLTVSSAGLITVENCNSDYIVKLDDSPVAKHPNFRGVACKADLALWVDKPKRNEPYVILSDNRTLSGKLKGKFYVVYAQLAKLDTLGAWIPSCSLTACGKEVNLSLEGYEPTELVRGELAPGSNIVNLKFVDDIHNHGLDGDIDVVVQQWDANKETYTANPLKNKRKVKVNEMVSSGGESNNTLDVELDGSTNSTAKHQIWIHHKKGIELEIPAIEGWWDDEREF